MNADQLVLAPMMATNLRLVVMLLEQIEQPRDERDRLKLSTAIANIQGIEEILSTE